MLFYASLLTLLVNKYHIKLEEKTLEETQAVQEDSRYYGNGIFGGVYRIENKLTGEFYIGASKYVPANRLQSHHDSAKSGANSAMARAIRQYGIEAFTIKTIATAKSEGQLRALELLHYLEAKMNSDKCINSGGKFRLYQDTTEMHSGANNPNAKLTEEQALIIARIENFKHGQRKQLSEISGISVNSIRTISRGTRWEKIFKKAQQLEPLTFSQAITLLEGK